MYLEYYKNKISEIPDFLEKYLSAPSMVRLKKIGYFCGMDYASNDVYDFLEYITRFDHSLTVALLTYRLTRSKEATLAGLFHDIATPCCSHVIDYMNNDFAKQESTEEYTERIIKADFELVNYLNSDNINVDDVVDFKKYTIVDNDRPKLCADRLDGIILTAISWCKNITLEDINLILESIKIYRNENGEDEIGFDDINVTQRIIEINNVIDIYCHTDSDNYMMILLGDIVKLGIKYKLFSYDDLYSLTEDELFSILNNSKYSDINSLLDRFYNIKNDDIPHTNIPSIKRRLIRPICNGKRC